jgi:hypothetical protein
METPQGRAVSSPSERHLLFAPSVLPYPTAKSRVCLDLEFNRKSCVLAPTPSQFFITIFSRSVWPQGNFPP